MIALDWALTAPRNLGLALLKAYRTVISPLYGDVCRYYPSCSAYTVHSVQQHGLIVGSFFGARRILRCHPWAEGGIDDAPAKKNFRYTVTTHGFVVPPRQRKG
ncbi:membrane protein insertion efficiency factor YidD [Mycetocola spongiae]|uniref:membrane protein insertion efficiency factor YidD n=1 Tax=Mycetocola spongiae TaxID=2859226 RepID=UPI001CF5AE92|nr:membrane protein insertion efficiency factor YidD [Mycetocola spongiae]UCR88246.1 membrane protein insertion efficiency factor YidD [Mycetocola spongiae]